VAIFSSTLKSSSEIILSAPLTCRVLNNYENSYSLCGSLESRMLKEEISARQYNCHWFGYGKEETQWFNFHDDPTYSCRPLEVAYT
jgi:hypothetical protein